MEVLRSIWSIRVGRISLIVLALVVLLAIFGSLLTPHDPFAQNAANRLKGVSWLHPFGTDYLGRDLLSRLLAGSGLSVVAAFEALGFALVIGVVPGLLSLYLGRPFEWISMRIMEALVALPFIVFAVSMAALLGNGLHQAMLAVGILMSPAFFRVTRAAGQVSVNSQYVAASRLMGSSTSWILRHHVWPKVLPPVAITAAAAIGNGLVVISSLTFLGIGVAPPTPSWGGILSDQVGYLYQQPFAIFPPAFLIIATVGAAHGLADALRDATNPSPRRAAFRGGGAKQVAAANLERVQ
ncbi:ABC transporter permease subunit [Rhizobium lusitanum]|uniref:ABC transporter permease subunit n=1 Tax=Rhizobium lusitanum TaxID=293958 RepID=A0A6L9UFN3_9HYPH|nr:ABC transporter permease [Rhizobium lusitanum]NEI74843.1 ABC transporter permease subunit [Rhizobium lusitanum]